MATKKKTTPKKAPKKSVRKPAATDEATPGTIVAPNTVLVEWRSLIDDVENPRFITVEEMSSLKESIKFHGVVEALAVQSKTMKIIGGHQRVAALRELEAEGWSVPDKVPAYVLDISNGLAAQLNVSLNRIGGEFDSVKLGRLLAKYSGRDFNLLASGFRHDEVAELVRQATMTPEQLANMLEGQVGELSTFAKSITLTVPFVDVKQRDQAKELLAKGGAKDHGAFLLSLLKRDAAMSRKSRK